MKDEPREYRNYAIGENVVVYAMGRWRQGTVAKLGPKNIQVRWTARLDIYHTKSAPYAWVEPVGAHEGNPKRAIQAAIQRIAKLPANAPRPYTVEAEADLPDIERVVVARKVL